MEYMHNSHNKLLHNVCEHFIIKYEISVFYPQIALQKAGMKFYFVEKKAGMKLIEHDQLVNMFPIPLSRLKLP